jgi:hypothetical protein
MALEIEDTFAPIPGQPGLLARSRPRSLEEYFGFEAAPAAALKTAVLSSAHSTAKQQLESLRKQYGLDSAKQQAEGYVKKQAADILKKSGAAAAEKFLKEQGRAIVKEAGQKLGLDAAKAYGKEFLKGMKIPNMPAGLDFQLPSKLTVDEIEKAAYNTGKAYAENAIQSKIGIHIELPKKLTLKEISRTVDSLIPDNAAEALNMTASIGLQVAAGAAASALTTLATATAIGSAVPGIGTVIGLGVGLATIALKGTVIAAFTQSACERNKAMCKCQTPPGWKKPEPGKRSPVEMLPWLAQEQHKLAKIVLKPDLCSLGPVPEAKNWFSTLSQLLVPYVGSTLPVMGLPALERLLPAYESAAKLSKQSPGYTHQGSAADLIKYGWAASKNSLGFVVPGVASPLATIRSRVTFLRQLAVDANKIGPQSGDLSTLRWNLATELNNAITQYTLNPSADNEKWFVQLGTAFAKLENAEKQKVTDTAKIQKEDEKRAKDRSSSKAGPLWKLYADRDNAMFQCSEAGVSSSAKVQPPACLNVAKIEAQIIELHRQGLKLPTQPKGSGYAFFEEKAEAAVRGRHAAPAQRHAAPAQRRIHPTQRAVLHRDVKKAVSKVRKEAAAQPAVVRDHLNALITQALTTSTDLLSLLQALPRISTLRI